jgi:hypothetical protein
MSPKLLQDYTNITLLSKNPMGQNHVKSTIYVIMMKLQKNPAEKYFFKN